jgi:hypothetical protein
MFSGRIFTARALEDIDEASDVGVITAQALREWTRGIFSSRLSTD